MSKILYFDCTSGISGDMTVGALLDLGIDETYFRKEITKLHVGGFDLVFDRKTKQNIDMMDFDVKIHTQQTQENCKIQRNLHDVLACINSSQIAEKAKEISTRIFQEIAYAEAKVHNKTIEEVYFHEVGAIDSIVDIVGTAICIAKLNPDQILAAPLHDGHGFIKCNGKILPVPVPAVAAMLENTQIPVVRDEAETELITPTGIGIAKCLIEKYCDMPNMRVEKIGYGAGKRETGKLGAVRVYLGDLL